MTSEVLQYGMEAGHDVVLSCEQHGHSRACLQAMHCLQHFKVLLTSATLYCQSKLVIERVDAWQAELPVASPPHFFPLRT